MATYFKVLHIIIHGIAICAMINHQQTNSAETDLNINPCSEIELHQCIKSILSWLVDI